MQQIAGEVHPLLEQGYWIAQIALALVAVAAAAIAALQIRTYRQYELFKLLEDSRTRAARRRLYHDRKTGDWWKNDHALERAASLVCATYDIVGLMAKGKNRRFFETYWAYSICWTHAVLKGYLAFIRKDNPEAYPHYEALYTAAWKKLDGKVKRHIEEELTWKPA